MRRRYRRVGLTAAQSAELWERWKKGEGLKSIGRVFGKPSSCIFAHIRPSGGIKPPKKLQLDWSPEQISGWLKRTFPQSEALHVSHETIYRSLYVQARGVLKKELLQHLRTRRPIRRSRYSSAKRDQRGRIADAVSISERPASAEDRAVPGHWEGDLLCHKRFTLAADIAVSFCDPQSPWQRGSNENSNRLLRQYLPRGIDLAPYSQAGLNKIARQLNERPRKTLDFQTPAERFSQCVAMTR